MPEYVRVKIKGASGDAGAAHTVLRGEVDANPDAYTVLKQPAVNLNGDPLPPETPSAENTGQSATAPKEKS